MEKIIHDGGWISLNLKFLNDKQRASLFSHIEVEDIVVLAVNLLKDDMRMVHAYKKDGSTEVFEFTMLGVSQIHDLRDLV